ncbi:MAG: hypothetical protein ABI222_10200 [Opitutaceae bacterium]
MTQKTTVLLTCAALVLGALSIRGQTAVTAPSAAPVPAPPTSSWTITPAVVSQYMLRGVRLGGPSFEPTVEFDSGNLGIGVWANFPLVDKVAGQSDPEIDPYAYYTFTLSNSASLVPGFTWYNYPNANESNGFYKTTFEPNVAFNYTVGGVKLTPKFYYDMVLKGPTYELNVSFAVPLKNAGTELDFLGTVGTYKWDKFVDEASPKIKNYGDYWLIGVSAPVAVSSSSKLIVGFAYTQGNNNYFKQSGSPKVANTQAVGRGVITLSYAVTF